MIKTTYTVTLRNMKNMDKPVIELELNFNNAPDALDQFLEIRQAYLTKHGTYILIIKEYHFDENNNKIWDTILNTKVLGDMR